MLTMPEPVHHDKEAYDLVMNIIGAHWNAFEYFGGTFDEKDFSTEEQQWVQDHYFPTDPVELAEWEDSDRKINALLAKKRAARTLAAA